MRQALRHRGEDRGEQADIASQGVVEGREFDGRTDRLFVDGAIAGASADPPASLSSPADGTLVFGDHPLVMPITFVGVLDEIAIYDKALEPERVRAHAAARQP